MEDKEKKAVAAALLILAGGIVGAGVALLLAPQSGQRTRKDIIGMQKNLNFAQARRLMTLLHKSAIWWMPWATKPMICWKRGKVLPGVPART